MDIFCFKLKKKLTPLIFNLKVIFYYINLFCHLDELKDGFFSGRDGDLEWYKKNSKEE